MKTYTTQECYERLQYFGLAGSLRSVQRLISSGALPSMKKKGVKGGVDGQGVYSVVSEEALEAFIEERVPFYREAKKRHRSFLEALEGMDESIHSRDFQSIKQKANLLLKTE